MLERTTSLSAKVNKRQSKFSGTSNLSVVRKPHNSVWLHDPVQQHVSEHVGCKRRAAHQKYYHASRRCFHHEVRYAISVFLFNPLSNVTPHIQEGAYSDSTAVYIYSHVTTDHRLF